MVLDCSEKIVRGYDLCLGQKKIKNKVVSHIETPRYILLFLYDLFVVCTLLYFMFFTYGSYLLYMYTHFALFIYTHTSRGSIREQSL